MDNWFFCGKTPHFGHNKKPNPGPRPSSGGAGKKGRARAKCARYRACNRREANRIARIVRHVRKHPNDVEAQRHLA